MPYIDRDGGGNVVAVYALEQTPGQEFVADNDAGLLTFQASQAFRSARNLYPIVAFSATAPATVANTTTESDITGAGIGTLLIPPNFAIMSRSARFDLAGRYSADASAPTVRFQVKFGDLVVIDTEAIAVTASADNYHYRIEGMITCRSSGASGAVIGSCTLFLGTGAKTVASYCIIGTPVTFDTTQQALLSITVIWGTASASNTLTNEQCVLEALG